MPDTKPPSKAPFVFLLIAAGIGGLAFPAILAPLRVARESQAVLSSSAPPLLRIYDLVSLERIAPFMVESLEKGSSLRWHMAYLPVALIIGVIIAAVFWSLISFIRRRFFLKENPSLVDDPEFEVRHGVVASPAIDHATAICRTLEPDIGNRFRRFFLGNLCGHPVIPAVPATRINDAPGNAVAVTPK